MKTVIQIFLLFCTGIITETSLDMLIKESAIEDRGLRQNTDVTVNDIRDRINDNVKPKKASTAQIKINKEESLACNSSFIDSFILRDNRAKHVSITFDYPFPECPKITKSCCTVSELNRFVHSFKLRVKTVKKMYRQIITVFEDYGRKRDDLIKIVDGMTLEDEKCANIGKSEVYYLVEKIHYIGKYKKYLVEDYLKYVLEYHSGFVCTICNAKMHEFLKIEDYATFTMNGNQCLEIFNQYYSFLNLHLNILKLSNLVKALQCIILKSFKKFDPFLNVDFEESLKDIEECFTKEGSTVFETNEKCAFLCKSLGIFNIVTNLDNMFSITNKAESFYYNTLFKKNQLITSRSFNMEHLSLMIFPYVKNPPLKIDEYNLVIDASKGIYPHHHRMNIDLYKEMSKIMVLGSTLLLSLIYN